MSDDTGSKKPAYTYGAAALGGLLAERESAPVAQPTFAEQFAAMTPEARDAFWRVRGPSPGGVSVPNLSPEEWAVARLGGPAELTGFRTACARLHVVLRQDVAMLVRRRRARLAATAGAR